MNFKLWGAVLLTFMIAAAAAAADPGSVTGTWSGNWTPKGGVPDAITVQLREDNSGKLSGKFLNPAPMDFTKAAFSTKTGMISVEAMDQKTGKHYKLDGKIEGTELKGMLAAGDVSGDIRLIKWTFFGR